ncbi:MAG: type III restriction endonuclease, partial [Clostridia bacterium]|nr:type III restriction endonuclease [Clostridia bacterium]
LKDAEPQAFDNVKNETFIRRVVKDFWDTYGEKRYEKMLPKLAIYGSEIKEVEEEIVPTLEKILEEMDISRDKILINVGDSKLTKDNDINEFNNLDTEKSNKQFIILVGKGKEGWNCRSLFGVALYRSPDSSIFVLQATMRCLRKITNVQQTASVYLSKDNYEILDNELNKNFKMSVKDIKNKENDGKVKYEVRVVPPPRFIKIKKINNKYNLVKKYNEHDSINLELDKIDLEKYKARIIRKESLADSRVAKVKEIDISDENIQYSEIMLCSEISRYIGELKCTEIKKILRNDINEIIELVSKYNQILYDWIIPKIVDFVYELEKYTTTEDKDVILLKEPEEEYYTFKAKPELVITNNDLEVLGVKNKSFHADTYCFDSKPEKELFLQYIKNKKIKEIYFTGMFTNAAQTDFYIQYIDPDSNTLRKYYPDFVAKFENNTYEIIEVKGDNKIDDAVVNAKKDAAMEIATESDMVYKIYKSSSIMEENVLDNEIKYKQGEIEDDLLMVAEDKEE